MRNAEVSDWGNAATRCHVHVHSVIFGVWTPIPVGKNADGTVAVEEYPDKVP